jgi:uncharacterized membrane-anchored protein YjiN (DUF445 family)
MAAPTASTAIPDEQRSRDLRRMKLLAGSLLALAAVVYALTTDTRDGVLGFVNAAAEAAMIGALADWFAVTALFRHPLGLPVPHTAIIPTRKDALGRSLQEFVAGNFLTEPVVRDAVRRAGVTRRVGTWLADRAHAERVSTELAVLARGLLRVMRDEDVTSVLEHVVVRQLAMRPWSPPAGRLLERVVHDRAHHRMVDLVVEQAHHWLLDHRDVVVRLVTDQAPSWSPAWMDERVGGRVYLAMLRFAREVRADPDHRLRQALDDALASVARDLQFDPYTRDRCDRFTQDLLARPDVRDAVSALWSSLRKVLVDAVEDPDSELRQRATAGLVDVGRRLSGDPAMAGRLDAYVEDALGYLVSTYAGEVSTVISDTVQRWDGREASRLIELHVGRDLQFIRINGTVVGGLAGLAIHAVTLAVR